MSLHRTVVLDVVGLTPAMLAYAPNLRALAQRGAQRPLGTVLPAVTCSAQSTFLTGRMPREHGVVGNGWYLRDLAEVMLWRQSNALVLGDKIWDEARARDPSFTVANLFWWFNMYGAVDWAVTPRPIYCADGRKIPDIHTRPAHLRDALTRRLGSFPLFDFWGPRASITSTEWIARCARIVFDEHAPTLTLVYLPHLDYDLQRFGPDEPRSHAAVRAVDAICGELIEHFERSRARVIVLSEYGIVPVRRHVALNRVLRRAGLLTVRDELGTEKLDAGASDAFAVADHQVAHVYVKRRETVADVRRMLEATEGVAAVLGPVERSMFGLDHERAGDLVAVSEPDAWFSYYYWLDDDKAPDFARTVDIHRKPGYDPAELFFDPSLSLVKLRVAWKLARKMAGFRTLLDVVPLDGSLVRGSHGRLPTTPAEGPVLLSSTPDLVPETVAATEVRGVILDHVFADEARVSRAGHAPLPSQGEDAGCEADDAARVRAGHGAERRVEDGYPGDHAADGA